jgi:Niemann-Pick C1 protein
LTDDRAVEIMKRRCFDFYKDAGDPVCCTNGQVLKMEQEVQMAEGVFGRCQTCLNNMLKSICALACAPDQSKYIVPTVSRNFLGVDYVSEVEFRIDGQFMAGVFNSCIETVVPSSGRLAMDLACGSFGAKDCTPERWYRFLGQPSLNPLVPFKIDYTVSDNPAERYESETKECHDSYEDFYPCACVDCSGSCPVGDPPQADDRGLVILELNGVTFILALLFGAFGVFGVVLGTVAGRNTPRLPAWIGGVDSFHDVSKRFFTKWGTWCAKHPVLVLFISSWIIAGLSHGAFRLKIITDPVELWAAPGSRSRLEKDYFDSRFGPFYRTEQLFIKPTNQDYVSLRVPGVVL